MTKTYTNPVDYNQSIRQKIALPADWKNDLPENLPKKNMTKLHIEDLDVHYSNNYSENYSENYDEPAAYNPNRFGAMASRQFKMPNFVQALVDKVQLYQSKKRVMNMKFSDNQDYGYNTSEPVTKQEIRAIQSPSSGNIIKDFYEAELNILTKYRLVLVLILVVYIPVMLIVSFLTFR